MRRFIVILITFLFIFSCNSEIKPATFKTTPITDKFEAEISGSFDMATTNNELSKTINSNIEKAIISLISEPLKNTTLKSVLKDFNDEYLKFKTDFPESSEPTWELYIETEKTYQSETVITIAISVYDFRGGAHGNDKIEFLNLDAETGEVLNRNDIINDFDGLKVLAEKFFKKSLEADSNQVKMNDYFFGEPFQLPENIGFSEDGIVMLYNTYEIASYDKGYTEFVIPFEELESLLKLN